ncbi:MAG: HD domain-containing protein [Patescibacteria group bacterium]
MWEGIPSCDELIAKAKRFAEKIHEKQTRYNKAKTPAITHMAEVAGLVEEAGGSWEEVAAAWLHDTVEDADPPISIEDIRGEFGEEVATIVDGLTDPKDFEGKPLLWRKIKQSERVLSKSRSVCLVKIADQISNVRSLAHDPPEKWDQEKCLTYAVGALLIVQNCSAGGIHLYLKEKFLQVYQEAIQKHL